MREAGEEGGGRERQVDRERVIGDVLAGLKLKIFWPQPSK